MTHSHRPDARLVGVAAVVVLGAIMSILDTTIVNVAIDALSRDFHASLSSIQWVATGYMLALAAVIPLTGWAADRFGTKRLWMASVTLFLAGSALCGLAWSESSLIAFRVLQGLGGGMIMPVGMTVLTRTAGPERVGRVMSVVGVPMVLGPVLGPVLGGWLVDDASWRWIFYVNLPIGVPALLLAWRVLERDRPQPHERLDWLGFLLLSPGLALLVYGLSEAAAQGSVASGAALASALGGAGLIAAFVVHALRAERPLLDLRLFGRRAFSAAAGTSFLLGGALFGAMILLPLYYQVVRGESALQAGLLLVPQGLGAAAAMPLAGRLTDRIGAGRVVLVGLALVLAGTVGFTQLGAGTSYAALSVALLVRGLGMGASMMPAMSAAYQTLDRAAVARATSTLNILQRIGGSLGTALLAVVLQHRITDAVGSAGSLSGAAALPPAARAHVAPLLAGAFGETFWWALALAALAYVPAVLLPRARPRMGGAEPAAARAGAASEAA